MALVKWLGYDSRSWVLIKDINDIDNFVMENFQNWLKRLRDPEKEQETNFDHQKNPLNQSIMTIDTSNPNFKHAAEKNLDTVLANNEPLQEIHANNEKLETQKRKNLLRELGFNINKGDGKFSKQVLEKLKVTVNTKGKVSGAEHDGTKIIGKKVKS